MSVLNYIVKSIQSCSFLNNFLVCSEIGDTPLNSSEIMRTSVSEGKITGFPILREPKEEPDAEFLRSSESGH